MSTIPISPQGSTLSNIFNLINVNVGKPTINLLLGMVSNVLAILAMVYRVYLNDFWNTRKSHEIDLSAAKRAPAGILKRQRSRSPRYPNSWAPFYETPPDTMDFVQLWTAAKLIGKCYL
jgi:hypothetical protein